MKEGPPKKIRVREPVLPEQTDWDPPDKGFEAGVKLAEDMARKGASSGEIEQALGNMGLSEEAARFLRKGAKRE